MPAMGLIANADNVVALAGCAGSFNDPAANVARGPRAAGTCTRKCCASRPLPRTEACSSCRRRSSRRGSARCSARGA
jgi:hypothetical protein